MNDSGETHDKILGGRLCISQPRKGYRFSVDALLLADFAEVKRNDRVLELGAGCGVVSLIIALRRQPREIVALEVDEVMARLARKNCIQNGFDWIKVIQGDLRDERIDGLEPQSFDWVVANPPYYRERAGRESPDTGRRLARSEEGATLNDFIKAAARYLRFGGKAAFVFVARRSVDIIAGLRAACLEPKRIRLVFPKIERCASNILVQAQKGAGVEAVVEPPLILYDWRGEYSNEAKKILGLE